MIVMKFGGTSMGDVERIQNVAEIIEKNMEKNPLVVVSAHSKVTDMLLSAAREACKGNVSHPIEAIRKRHRDLLVGLGLDETARDSFFDDLELILKGISLIRELTPRTMDMVASFGERASSRTLAEYMRSRGHENCRQHDAWELGLRTDSEFMNALPTPNAYDLINVETSRFNDELIITTGFIGKDAEGNITTLGRGGSDYSAAIFGAGIDAKEIQIWTDVSGVMTADPRIVPNALSIEQLTFDEASELAYFGGKVLHPSTMKPAVDKNIPIRVLNTFKPDHPGTVITKTAVASKYAVKSIVTKRDVITVNITSTRMLGASGFMAMLFNTFSKYNIVIDLISTSEVSVSITLATDKNLDDALNEIRHSNFKPQVNMSRKRAIVCIVGNGMRHFIGLSGKVFSTIANADVNIEMISQGASEINISVVIDNEDASAVVAALHDAFFGNEQ
ncbi:MAG: aspartate kinase [Planctomycetota bacterium]